MSTTGWTTESAITTLDDVSRRWVQGLEPEQDLSFHFEERAAFHFKGLHGQHVVFAVGWDSD